MKASLITTNQTLERRSIYGVDWNNIELLTVIEPNDEIKSVLESARLPLEIVDLDGRACYILHRSLYFYKGLQQAKSSTSQARYVARSEDKMKGLLLQYLPPFSQTSRHYHKSKTETYHNLEGECFLEINRKVIRLEGNTATVYPNQIHQIKTRKHFALTLLVIRGDPKGLSMDDHNYI